MRTKKHRSQRNENMNGNARPRVGKYRIIYTMTFVKKRVILLLLLYYKCDLYEKCTPTIVKIL